MAVALATTSIANSTNKIFAQKESEISEYNSTENRTLQEEVEKGTEVLEEIQNEERLEEI